MPGREPVEDLRGVEDRGRLAVLGDLHARERAGVELHAQQELDAPPGPFAVPRKSRLRLERQQRRNDVTRGLRVGRRPSAAEPIAAGDATVAAGVLRARQPFRGRDQVLAVGDSEEGIAPAVKDSGAEERQGLGAPGPGVLQEA
jgi:hypothetical protein